MALAEDDHDTRAIRRPARAMAASTIHHAIAATTHGIAHANHHSETSPCPRSPTRADIDGNASGHHTAGHRQPDRQPTPKLHRQRRPLRYGRQNLRLPGSDQTVRGAPVLPMIDPRMQGLAGVVHFIGSLTGAVDPHCLDLEAWRGMTPEERGAHHVVTDHAQMDTIAARYNCKPPPARPGDPTYDMGR